MRGGRPRAPVADIVLAGASQQEDRLRELAAAGKVSPPARARPASAPRPRKVRKSATAAVLADRDAER